MAYHFHRGSALPRNASYIPFVFLLITTTLILCRHNPFYESLEVHLYEESIPEAPKPSDPPAGPLITPNIWQIMLPHAHQTGEPFSIDPVELVDTPSWLSKNPNHNYKLVTPEWADAFVDEHFKPTNPVLAQTYHALTNPGLKSDLLRYLILSIKGGVYTDIDTVALQPIDTWIPPPLSETVRLVVGIEFDQRDGLPWADIPHALQFCQWTIAAAPGHPVFAAMVDRALSSLRELADDVYGGVGLGELRPTSLEVMNATGPAAWTDVVFEQLRLVDPGLTNLRNLSGLTEPRLFGDILVLHIDGFGVGQMHSGSTNDGTYPEAALVKHSFRGSWREKSAD